MSISISHLIYVTKRVFQDAITECRDAGRKAGNVKEFTMNVQQLYI